MKYFKLIFFVITVLNFYCSFGQVGVGTRIPNEDSMLEIKSTNKGFLLPRIALTSLDSPSPLTAHVEGMTVYNTSTTLGTGYYYNDGSKWVKLSTLNDIKDITDVETSLSLKIDGRPLYAIKGSFTASGTSSAVTINLPQGISSYYSITIYKPDGSTYRNTVSLVDLTSSTGNLITGNGFLNEVFPAGNYDYILEYFK